jgi:hypothetical protein
MADSSAVKAFIKNETGPKRFETGIVSEEQEIDAAITEAEAEYASGGQLLDMKESVSVLRKRYFG